MILKRITVAAGTISNWIPVSRRAWGNIGFTINPQVSAAGTYDVEFTESQIQRGTNTSVSRSATTLTVNLINHGLAVNDSAIFSQSADYDGERIVTVVVDADTFEVTVPAAGDARFAVVSPVIADVVTGGLAITGKNSGLIDASIVALRLNCTNSTTAAHDFLINQYEV